jgi:predicted enzyme related to lactoylglutathione lyase
MKFAHTNIIARDWKKLSKFYQEVFHCVPVPPQRDLSGDWVVAFSGVQNAHIQGEHLLLPGFGENGPTLEIFSYNEFSGYEKSINALGFSHIAFAVDDVKATFDLVKKNGGKPVGELVSQKYPNGKIGTFVYCRDPEGNIIELQKWQDI